MEIRARWKQRVGGAFIYGGSCSFEGSDKKVWHAVREEKFFCSSRDSVDALEIRFRFVKGKEFRNRKFNSKLLSIIVVKQNITGKCEVVGYRP